MFKRIVALLAAALLALTAAACADTYTDRDRDLTFEYDAAAFEVTSDEADDVLVVTLTGSRAEWGAYGIAFDLRDLDDGDPVPKLSDYTDNLEEGAQAVQGEWNGFADVIMYSAETDDTYEQVFVVPVPDEDGEIEDVLTVSVAVRKLDDEEAAMDRDDAISAVLDSMRLLDD